MAREALDTASLTCSTNSLNPKLISRGFRAGQGRGALAGVGRAGDGRDAIHKLGPEDDVGVAEHALLQRHHDELGVGEVRLDHAPDVLRVAQVQRSIHLHRRAVLKLGGHLQTLVPFAKPCRQVLTIVYALQGPAVLGCAVPSVCNTYTQHMYTHVRSRATEGLF